MREMELWRDSVCILFACFGWLVGCWLYLIKLLRVDSIAYPSSYTDFGKLIFFLFSSGLSNPPLPFLDLLDGEIQ